jgi:hypothetical protein
VGFQTKPPRDEALTYYRSKLYPGGRFNAQAALELAARIGVERLLKEVVPAMEQDFFHTPAEDDSAPQEGNQSEGY